MLCLRPSPSTLLTFFLVAQARLGAHRAMLCHCLSLLSSSLSKQQLKSGLSVEEVAAVARTAYLAGPEARLGKPSPRPADPECQPPRSCAERSPSVRRASASFLVLFCCPDGGSCSSFAHILREIHAELSTKTVDIF